LRRERRRCCAAVVVLVVRTDAGRERRRAARRCGDRVDAGTAAQEIPAELREVKKSQKRDFADRSREPGHCGAERIRAGLQRGTGG